MINFETFTSSDNRRYNSFEYAVFTGDPGLVGADSSGNDAEFTEPLDDLSSAEVENV